MEPPQKRMVFESIHAHSASMPKRLDDSDARDNKVEHLSFTLKAHRPSETTRSPLMLFMAPGLETATVKTSRRAYGPLLS